MYNGNNSKIHLKMAGIINTELKPQKSKIKLYNTLALSSLLYGSENRTTKARNARKIRAAQMKYVYVRQTAENRCTGHKIDIGMAN